MRRGPVVGAKEDGTQSDTPTGSAWLPVTVLPADLQHADGNANGRTKHGFHLRDGLVAASAINPRSHQMTSVRSATVRAADSVMPPPRIV